MTDKIIEYKCPCCGGAIAFDAALQKLKCPFCDTEFEAETLIDYDEALKRDSSDEIQWNKEATEAFENDEGMVVYVCENCGGEIVGTKETAATTCPYCDSPCVISGHLAGTLKPDFVVPFQLTKEEAKAKLREFYKDKPLLPKEFAEENKIEEIKGIYVPFWLFDASADANVRYRATTISSWSDSNYNYTKTSYYSITRSGGLAFENIPVDGSTRMPDDFMESIEPFDISKAVDFQTAYLAGFLADKYDVDADSSIDRANARVKQSAVDALRETVTGYSTVTVENSSVKTDKGRVRYGLLPVWMLSTKWKDKVYTFAMNGQTGKFVGTLPIDGKKKFGKWLLGMILTTIAAFGVILLFKSCGM